MRIKYIFHSGYFIETERAIIIIDYYEGDFGSIDKILQESNKRIYILSSHAHADHYDTSIYDFKESEDFFYVLSDDISADTVPKSKNNVQFLAKGETYKDDMLEVKAYGSTDIGISFYIEIEKKSIFHAGDLNNWHWEEEVDAVEAQGYENAFLSELEEICSQVTVLDILLFPIDKRLGKDYFRGAKQFVEKIKPSYFIPMHFGEDIGAGNGFKEHAQNLGIIHCDIQAKGDEITI